MPPPCSVPATPGALCLGRFTSPCRQPPAAPYVCMCGQGTFMQVPSRQINEASTSTRLSGTRSAAYKRGAECFGQLYGVHPDNLALLQSDFVPRMRYATPYNSVSRLHWLGRLKVACHGRWRAVCHTTNLLSQTYRMALLCAACHHVLARSVHPCNHAT